MGSCVRRSAAISAIAVLCLSLTALLPAHAGEALAGAAPKSASYPESGDVLMQADELVYNRDTKVVTATGHVEIANAGRVLVADKVTYDSNTGIVTADGNVSLVDQSGDVAFADHVVLRNDLKDGVVETLSVLLSDKSRLAGSSASRKNGTITTLNRAVYSPCEICKEKGQKNPLWQIKAFRVVHDKVAQRIRYEDAYMEIFGVPVLYVPYFSQPDPSVKRQSGLLTPSIGNSSELGQQVTIPYYWVISPDKDLTLSPRYTTREGMVYQGQYRQRFGSGQFETEASGTWPSTKTANTPADNNFRGHLFSNGEFGITPEWSWGYQAQVVSDATYLRKYNISDATDLTSNVHLNRFNGRNSFTTDAYFFRGLLASDDSATTPWVAPVMNFEYFMPDKIAGGQLSFTGNAMSLGRERGADSKRLIAEANWEKRVTSRRGFVYRMFGNLRGDYYAVNNVQDPSVPASSFGSTTITRALPTIGAESSYPLVKSDVGYRQIVEPIVQIIYSPNVGNSVEIPNEDSLSFEFDDTNLFSEDRYAGYDRWETGTRANVGMRYAIYGDEGGQATALLGQSFSLRDNNSYSVSSGLQEQNSDYVGRLMLAPNDHLLAVHRFRIDNKDFSFKRNEVNVLGMGGPLTAEIGYAYFSQDQFSTTAPREEIILGSILKLDDYWRLFGRARRDLANHSPVSNQVGFGYEDECFDMSLGFYQTFVRDRDIQPENSVLLQITFKTLGTAQVGTSN